MSTDERLIRKSAGDLRRPRTMVDRPVTENRTTSDNERVELFRQSFFQSALPDLPKIDGFHVCWLTTTNPRDSIQARARLGYVPVKPEEIAGWEHATVKTGEYAGLIGVNEMVAFKLPIELYDMYMREAHHDAPHREEERLQDTIRTIEDQAKGTGGRLDVGDGSRELGEHRAGSFDLNS